MEEYKNKEVSMVLLPDQAVDRAYIINKLSQMKDLRGYDIENFKIVRRSIDARKNPVKVNLGILVPEIGVISTVPKQKEYKPVDKEARKIIIVGAGPAGLFAALTAIELGLRPVILERGKDVDSRRIDIAEISRRKEVNPDSNFCFGEGGAGAFSDGKLFTRSKKRGSVKEVLEILHQFGASENILIDAHPHIGSDKLPRIIKAIREKIKECGGKVKFNCKVEDIILEGNRAIGVVTSGGEKIYGPVFLATGHSARDTYRMLHGHGVKIEPKGLAIGVRLEHPQDLIDKIQYHSEEGRGKFLPAAEYSFVDQADGRGVYSFCMCPGGVIVPAVSSRNQIVVNGMSASARSGKWANSGYVVELHPGDISEISFEGPFEMMALQEKLEKDFSEESKGILNAPAQRIEDFLANKESKTLPATSYAPGIHPANFNKLFPAQISERLKAGLQKIGKRCKDFIRGDAVMIGLESRTSSPIRIPRDKELYRHLEIEDLYPVGEGAGYAGGIVSSAIDGINSVKAFYSSCNK